MKIFITILLITQCLYSSQAQNNIYVLGNENLINESVSQNIISSSDRSDSDILIFLGNALTGNKQKEASEKIGSLRKSFERVYIVPGQSEWNSLKSENLKKLGDYLDDKYQGDVIVPENSCGAIEVKQVNEDLALVFIDSEWYFNDWNEDKSLNKGCAISSRQDFWTSLADKIGGLKAKRVFLIAYHPITRFDSKGGYNNIKEQIFPLADVIPGLYLPMPLLGTLIADTRSYFKPRVGSLSELYKKYSSNITNLIKDHGQITLITSEAKYSSVYSYKGCPQLNINTSVNSESITNKGALFFYEKQPTYLKISLTEKPYTTSVHNTDNDQLFKCELLDINQYAKDIDPSKIPSVDMAQMKVRPIRYEEDLVNLNKLLFGNLYKKYYKDSVSVSQLDLSTYLGGLKPIRLGGGKQTTSLRLMDSTGHVYLARSLKKDPEKSIPVSLRIKSFKNVKEYYYMSANPLGFLISQPLEKAANILHTTPVLMHLPMQTSLAPYNNEIGNELILFRERAAGDWRDKESYGYSNEIISSSKMIKKINDNKGTADAEMYLRARLVDYMINDWDRHADQWRWATITDNEKNVYQPIPRDRDKVFSKLDGMIMTLIRPYSIHSTQIRDWDDHLTTDDVKWMHFKSAYLDNLLLSTLTDRQWQEQTEYVAQNLTKEIQDTALGKLPPSFEDGIPQMRHNLNSRISELESTSNKLKVALRHKSIVRASNNRDSINIHIQEDQLHLTIFSEKEGQYFKKFENIFSESECNELWIYGLDSHDNYHITGGHSTDIKLILIGGYGKDKYNNQSQDENINVYDDQSKKSLSGSESQSIEYHFTQDKNIHSLTRLDVTPTHKYTLPRLSFNSDDGFLLGANRIWNKTGFKSKSLHSLGVSYLTNRMSLMLDYSYKTTATLTGKTKYMDAYYSGTQRQLAYFGGNGSTSNFATSFYNVNLSDARLELGISKSFNEISELSAGLYGWTVKVERETDLENESRYILEAPEVEENIFNRNYYAGAKLEWSISNFDSNLTPTKGARLHFGADSRFLFDDNRANLTLTMEYDYYKNILFSERLIFSTKLRASHVFGAYYLYEGSQLGGAETLRGFVAGRYTGNSSFAHNSNLHLRIFDNVFGDFLPTAMGISGSFDHGRVWSDFDTSEEWLTSWGAGIWLRPLDIAIFSISNHQSNEGNQIRALFGWQF